MLFEDFIKIVFKENKVEINQETEKIISESYEFLKEFSKDKIIYGVNTGFGPMAQYRIEDKDRLSLQYNLIRSHSAGMGDYFSPEEVRAMILCRLNTLSLGKSGVHPSLIHLMKELINREITPLIFKHGGVGASGDLVQLAHLALVLIGEGEVLQLKKTFYTGSIPSGRNRTYKNTLKRRYRRNEWNFCNDGDSLFECTLCNNSIGVDCKAFLCNK